MSLCTFKHTRMHTKVKYVYFDIAAHTFSEKIKVLTLVNYKNITLQYFVCKIIDSFQGDIVPY